MPNTVTGNVPERMRTGRTALLVEDPEKGTAFGNYRPITCLPIMWKYRLSGIVSYELYTFLDGEGLSSTRRTKQAQTTTFLKDDLKGEQNKEE